MDDIVERLRAIGDELSEDYYPTVYAAAAEIASLSETKPRRLRKPVGTVHPLHQ